MRWKRIRDCIENELRRKWLNVRAIHKSNTKDEYDTEEQKKWMRKKKSLEYFIEYFRLLFYNTKRRKKSSE